MKTIAIFRHDPECSQQCVDAMIRIFEPHYSIRLFDYSLLSEELLRGVDMIVFGGGIGDSDKYYDLFKRRDGNMIADYIERGGHYLGICMGAYWASKDYFDLLKDIEPVQYIKRKSADVKRSYATVASVRWNFQNQTMFFYDGPAFIGYGNHQTVASYANGDPMAIIQGRIGLIGCHPESEEEWFNQYKYIRKYWHNREHHRLLLNFVQRLMKEK
jgi:glutamine amidotransferase-like uncharacterized protein